MSLFAFLFLFRDFMTHACLFSALPANGKCNCKLNMPFSHEHPLFIYTGTYSVLTHAHLHVQLHIYVREPS